MKIINTKKTSRTKFRHRSGNKYRTADKKSAVGAEVGLLEDRKLLLLLGNSFFVLFPVCFCQNAITMMYDDVQLFGCPSS